MPPRARGKWWTPLGLAALCAHCTLGAAAVLVGGAGLAVLPTVGGVPLAWVAPPFLILGAFGVWLWSGRAASPRDARDACASCPPSGDEA